MPSQGAVYHATQQAKELAHGRNNFDCLGSACSICSSFYASLPQQMSRITEFASAPQLRKEGFITNLFVRSARKSPSY